MFFQHCLIYLNDSTIFRICKKYNPNKKSAQGRLIEFDCIILAASYSTSPGMNPGQGPKYHKQKTRF